MENYSNIPLEEMQFYVICFAFYAKFYPDICGTSEHKFANELKSRSLNWPKFKSYENDPRTTVFKE